MIDAEDWGDQLPADTQRQLQKIFWDSAREGAWVLTPERTAQLLERHRKLGTVLKRMGSVQIPLLGKLMLEK